jgi:hypothetical protein
MGISHHLGRDPRHRDQFDTPGILMHIAAVAGPAERLRRLIVATVERL